MSEVKVEDTAATIDNKDVDMDATTAPAAEGSASADKKPEVKEEKPAAEFLEPLPVIEGKSEDEVQKLLAGAAKQSEDRLSVFTSTIILCLQRLSTDHQSTSTSQTPTSLKTDTSSPSHAAMNPCTAGYLSRPLFPFLVCGIHTKASVYLSWLMLVGSRSPLKALIPFWALARMGRT